VLLVGSCSEVRRDQDRRKHTVLQVLHFQRRSPLSVGGRPAATAPPAPSHERFAPATKPRHAAPSFLAEVLFHLLQPTPWCEVGDAGLIRRPPPIEGMADRRLSFTGRSSRVAVDRPAALRRSSDRSASMRFHPPSGGDATRTARNSPRPGSICHRPRGG